MVPVVKEAAFMLDSALTLSKSTNIKQRPAERDTLVSVLIGAKAVDMPMDSQTAEEGTTAAATAAVVTSVQNAVPEAGIDVIFNAHHPWHVAIAFCWCVRLQIPTITCKILILRILALSPTESKNIF